MPVARHGCRTSCNLMLLQHHLTGGCSRICAVTVLVRGRAGVAGDSECGDGSEGAALGARVDEGACGEGLSGMRAQYTSV